MPLSIRSRGYLVERCAECRLRENVCMCAAIHPITIKTQLLVIMHHTERDRVTNSIRPLERACNNFEVELVGAPERRFTFPHNLLHGRTPVVLYPDPAAPLLQSFVDAQPKNTEYAVIVPDGTWTQSKKLVHSIPELWSVPKVRLSDGLSTNYTLRRNQREGGMCSGEAIARALGIIEGERVEREVLALVGELVERVLWARKVNRGYKRS